MLMKVMMEKPVANPGFDLRGPVDFVKGRG